MCGVFGIWGHSEAAKITYLGLHALQHRGQESAGIASTDGERLFAHRAMGLVQAGFSERELGALPGNAAIGHVRYSTAGGSQIKNAQPLAVDYAQGSIALAHNGNLTNHDALRSELELKGSIFQSSTDTETIVHLFARSTEAAPEDRIVDALSKVEGAYSLLWLTESKLVAVRDPRGIRPLALGRIRRGDRESIVVASEPTSFELIGAEYERDVEPGEMLVVDESGVRSSRPFEARPRAHCLFEYVYFARPDAALEGASVYEVRKELGRRLADEHPLLGEDRSDAIVVPVPDSGVPSAIGFGEGAGLPFEMGLIRSHYVGRTFIEPQDSIRHFGVRLKLSPNRNLLAGRRVVVVDDSIVRGTTSRKIVRMLRDAGAREVHVRISSPPTKWPCFYGIDTPTRSELIASTHSVEHIRDFLEADSVGYLSLDHLVGAVRAVIERSASPARGAEEPSAEPTPPESASRRRGFCHACFSGEYPVPIPRHGAHRLRLVQS
jgi:amidophosphoribosyltransferase